MSVSWETTRLATSHGDDNEPSQWPGRGQAQWERYYKYRRCSTQRVRAKEDSCEKSGSSFVFASKRQGGFGNDRTHRCRVLRHDGLHPLLGSDVKLHVQGIGLVDFEGITFQSVPALKLVAHHAPELLLTGKLLDAVVTVKLKDVDLSHTFHLRALNHR